MVSPMQLICTRITRVLARSSLAADPDFHPTTTASLANPSPLDETDGAEQIPIDSNRDYNIYKRPGVLYLPIVIV